MAHLPSALRCHSARPSCTFSPVRWTAKSTIVVTPPHAAAIVPVSNVSEANVPPKGSSMWVWTSMPPGTTYFPVASIDRRFAIAGSASAKNGLAGREHGGDRLAVDQHVGLERPVGQTTVPPRDRACHGVPLARDDLVVGVGAAVAVERPAVADLLDLVEVEVAHDQLRLVRVADVADELALGIDEVALPVEVVVADVGLDADAVDRPT